MDTILMCIAGVAIVAFLVVSVIASIVTYRRRQAAISHCRYRPNKSLMVGVERKTYQLLNEIFGQRFYIIPQVAVSSLLRPKANRVQDEASGFIEHKMVDFVFCNKTTLRPVCAVKLDDTDKAARRELGGDPKDLAKFFRTARLPFVHISKGSRLDRQTIIEEFSRVVYETSLE